ncbi:DUF1852 domain-containing protein [Xanthomonas campestris]|uniref:DUF1852 domain-containing protein n=1 Tax=Xanthomonas campestris TaxID=339 RepID=UPI000E32B574|nr:DUF1852 domain-containing protein [Xanthomonas campestris]MEA9489201.1 DUF1852 domain-containing protein [Xanthomonas campestris]MEA9508736.1 DUF1852 domain-containing protein [Xanthomonas campestris]MEA9576625.1 DUF1852 domain-containing protein [Xanthomonas campestris]MEB2111091.1 DUF1852 domain-containing protein [Xanthomonas campestris pv. campestris]RFF69915.1 DUF1852 domain-containing protein [Xanthomonas campestris pv. campestris]
MTQELTFSIKSLRFDEDYRPAANTRNTTNFANLARGQRRQENLRNTLAMINNRFNDLAHWDNPTRDRYAVELDIISVEMKIGERDTGDAFPLIEILQPSILDQTTGARIDGIAGNNFSSYVRDYDFSVLLPAHNQDASNFSLPEGFGSLHGKLFKNFVHSDAYKARFTKPPVICISVSSSKVYHRTGNQHPILGIEYRQDEGSLTDRYFEKMGLQVRYFMPPNSVAPLAFYFLGDLLNDYTNLELIGTISTMETFQKIYRPEIYNANSAAGAIYQPSLKHQDYSATQIVYDRQERSQLAVTQGKFTQEHFIKPYGDILARWASSHAFSSTPTQDIAHHE